MGKSQKSDRADTDELQDLETPEPTMEEPPAAEAGDEDELSQVRDILFGSQARSMGRRLERVEDRMAQENRQTREEFRSRLDELERLLHDEIAGVVEQLRREERARAAAVSEVVSEMKELARVFDRRGEEAEARWDQSATELRDQLDSQGQDFGAKLRELSRKLERDTKDLRDDKADRKTLATMLGELSNRLNRSVDDER